ncbi:MAG: hypothetical protein M1825_002849 [Sarcosagium campestre]|nr:MAG: hypothetical protein M1825_002849 [Sarcosagium campestre]
MTIVFIQDKRSVLISTNKDEAIGPIKQELLSALTSAYPKGGFSSGPVPESADDILLGVMIDRSNPYRGFTELQSDHDTPSKAKIADGDLVAYTFKNTAGDSEVTFNVTVPDYVEDEEDLMRRDEMDEPPRGRTRFALS